MTERKLASVRTVDEIRPIEGADAIEAAIVGGWQCVVKKGVFQPGNLGVFFEIDAVPPDSSVYSFLWNKPGEAGPRPYNFRIRTKKLRGCLSQGLLLPLTETLVDYPEIGTVTAGMDLTLPLGVTKYEPHQTGFAAGHGGGPWPGFCPKTAEERVQNCKRVLEELRGKPYAMTLKLDGTSFTCGVDAEGKFHVCSRNLSVDPPDLRDTETNVYWKMALKYDLERICRERGVAVQGEIVGPGIQKNPLGLTEPELFIFTVHSEFGRLPHHSLAFFCDMNGLHPVPTVETGEAFNETLESLLRKAEGKYDGTMNEREGLVVRPRDEGLYSETLRGNLSFKVISNQFLLKERD